MIEVTQPAARPLRVGLLLNSTQVSAWVSRMVERIDAEGHGRVCLLVLRDPATPAPPRESSGPPWERQARRVAGGVLHRLLRFFTERSAHLPDPFKPVDIGPRYAGLPTVTVKPQQQLWSDRLSDEELQQIRAHEPDVLIRIGFRILRGGILTAARHGVWSFHHGDNQVNRGGPPGWWEAMQQWPVTGCTLQVLSEDLDNGLVLARTWGNTINASSRDNTAQNYWKSLSMLPRELARLQRMGAQRYFEQAMARQAQPEIYSERLYRNASPKELMGLLVKRLAHRLSKTWLLMTHQQQWILLVHTHGAGAQNISPSGPSLNLALWRFKRITPPPDRFWADPFLLEHEGRTWLYFEELDYGLNRGHISVAELTSSGALGAPMKALVEPHHLSYPFVFEHEGSIYMLPESRASGKLTLYRCLEMPHRWEPVMDLMQGVEAVDATLLHHAGRWWLFVNLIENPGAGSSDELFLFYADDFRTQQWTPHPLNPIVSDVRCARPAGRILQRDGIAYRPAQDCSLDYGWGFSLMRIDTLSTTEYAETRVTGAEPRWATDIRATHTLAQSSRHTVIDANTLRPGSLTSLMRQLSRWTGRP